jgi:hypothetical protein
MGLQQQVEQSIQAFLSLQKAGPGISVSTGLVFYDLEAEAKFQYPVLAPIRKTMPRIGSTNPMGGQGLAAHWNAITNPNTGNVPLEASEGQSGGLIQPTVVPRIATYKLLALDSVVTWQAEWSGVGYEDVRSAAQRMTLDSMILGEEPRLLWGNSGTAGVGLNFGQANTPTYVSQSNSGGTLSNGVYYVAVAALTYQGYQFAIAPAANGGGGSVAVIAQYTKANGDGTSLTMNGGVSQVSAIGSMTTLSGGSALQSFVAQTKAIPGAAAYAWFVGTTNAAGSLPFNQITTINQATVTAITTATQAANYTGSATDYSANPLAFDGLITQGVAGGGYFKSLDGAALTSDGANGCVEINTAFKYFWDVYKISPTHIWAGSGTINAITKVILSGTNVGGVGYRVELDNSTGSLGGLVGTAFVSSVNNRFALGARKPVPIDIHPNIPDGHLFMDLEINPYPSSNIPYARAVRTLRDYFQVLWPPSTSLWRNSIFAAEMLQLYVPYGLGLISGISN